MLSLCKMLWNNEANPPTRQPGQLLRNANETKVSWLNPVRAISSLGPVQCFSLIKKENISSILMMLPNGFNKAFAHGGKAIPTVFSECPHAPEYKTDN